MINRPVHRLTINALFILLLIISRCTTAHAACSVVSTTGYTVNISIIPVSIVTSTTNCPWGYNYNVQLSYVITFTGTHIPASLYTLQGNVICGTTSLFFDLPNNGGIGNTLTTSNPYISNSGSAYNYAPGVPGCLTANVYNLSCATVQVQISGPGIPNQTINCTTSLLPIELLGFTANHLDKQVELEWTTASESNNQYFTVEKTMDGVYYEEVGRTNGAGTTNSTNHYKLVDFSPYKGQAYYRLKQTDYNGECTYSSMISVDFNTRMSEPQVFPNPAGDQDIYISYYSEGKNEPMAVTVFDLAGKQVLTREQFSESAGNNTLLLSSPGEISKGTYLVHLNAGNRFYSKKLVVQ